MRLLTGDRSGTLLRFDLGKFVDAEINEVTGKMTMLLVEPNVDSAFVNKLDVKEGKLRLQYNSVVAVNDFIVVDRKAL